MLPTRSSAYLNRLAIAEAEPLAPRPAPLPLAELAAQGFSCIVELDPSLCPATLMEDEAAAASPAGTFAASAAGASDASAADSSSDLFSVAAALLPSAASVIEANAPVASMPSRSMRSRVPTARHAASLARRSPSPTRHAMQPKRAKSAKKQAAAVGAPNLNITRQLSRTHLNTPSAAAAASAALAAAAAASAAASAAVDAQLKQLKKQLAQEKKARKSLQTELNAREELIQTLQQQKEQAQAALRDERAKLEPPRLNLSPLPRLDHPSSREVEGKAGGPLRVGYVLSVNSDQNNAHHFLSDDVVHLMEDNKALPSEEEKKQWQWRETDPKATADYSHTDAPEQYLKAEALALPLYLQKLFQDRFTVHTESLELVQRLLIALDGGSKDRKHATRGAALMTDGRASQDAAQLRALMARIKSYDVLLLPSVLLFTDKERGAPFWYNALSSLEKSAELTVFPLIEVEKQMEIKDSYLTALLRSTKQYLPRDCTEEDAMAAENALSSLAKWTDKVAFVHEPANRHLAPTVLLPDFSSLLKLKADEQERFIHDVFTSLQSDVTASQWDVSPFEWFIKGTTSTRSNVAEVVKSAEEALKFMKAAHQEGHKLCAAQAGFILQPSMNGLLWESRTYFNRGRPLPLTLLNAAVQSKTVSTFTSIEVRGREMPAHREYVLCESQRTDFAQHILQLCETHCKLVSNSGILRVDLGEEYLHCDNAAELSSRAEHLAAESQLRSEQPRPCLWHCTGHGFIVRFFLNEVTSTLDINWFSQQTNFPIVYEAAYATAQQIIRVARIAQQGQEEEEEEELMEDAPASEPLPSAASAAPAASASPSASVVTAAASASSSSPKRKQFDDGGEEKMEQGSVAKRSKPEAAENGAPATAAANGRRARS